MARILVIDDEMLVRYALRELLEENGHVVEEAQDGEEGLGLIAGNEYDLVITDIIMPKKEGTETISEIKVRDPKLRILAISGGARIGATDPLGLARALGADGTLNKPFSDERFLEEVAALLAA